METFTGVGSAFFNRTTPRIRTLLTRVVNVRCMSKRRPIVACTAVVLLTAITSGSVSADVSVPPPTTTTVVEQYDEESGIIWSQIDDATIEVSLPD
jgi:hypothetical protein